MDRQLRRWLPVLVVVLALSFAAVAATGPGLTGRELPPPLPNPELAEPPASETEAPIIRQPVDGADEQEEDRSLLVALWAYLIVLSVLAATVLAYLLYHGIRWLLTERVARREISPAASQPDDAAHVAEVRDALRAGLADIDAGGDARRAIIACWLRLERVAAAAGTARQVADTPGDLVKRLLSRHQVSREALEQLADAYRLARYAPAAVGDDLLGVARRALRDVDAALGEVAAAAVAAPR